MPFDTEHHLRNALDYVANRSQIGPIITNPILFGIILVFIIILITYILDCENVLTFRVMFYLFIGMVCAVFAHDTLLNHQTPVEEVKIIETHDNLPPREIENRPAEYLPTTAKQLEELVSKNTYFN